MALAVSSYAEITINDIDKLVNDIKEERIGLSKAEIETAKDPFVYFRNGKKPLYVKSGAIKSKPKVRFVLSAIINDRTKINGRWYGLHGKVHGYRIDKIGPNYVLLTRNGTQVRVFLQKPRSKKIKMIVK
ncbi:hypothetical protein [Hydrogenimonas sp.]